MFIPALFLRVRTCKQPRCPSTEEWILKMCYIYKMKYYSAVRNKDTAGKWWHTWEAEAGGSL